MDHVIEAKEDYTIIRFSGSLANDLEEQLRSVLVRVFENSPMGIIIDLNESDFVSSNVLGLFFSLSKSSEESEKKVAFYNVNDELKKIFIITGVAKHLHIFRNLKDAIQFITDAE